MQLLSAETARLASSTSSSSRPAGAPASASRSATPSSWTGSVPRCEAAQHSRGPRSSCSRCSTCQLGTDNDASGDRDPAVLYSAMGRAQQELVDDTFRVLSIGFSYLDGPESISRYFNRRGPRPYSFIAYTNLGDLYLEQERYQDAADAYHAFVELDPYHAKAPLLQVEVIEAFKKGAFADLVLEGKENFVETYGPGSPYWQRFTFEQQPEVVAHLKSNVTDLAAYHHAQAQTTHDAARVRGRRALVPHVLAVVPRRRERRADELPARRGALRERRLPRRRVRVRAHGLRLSVPRQSRRGRLRGAARVREARRGAHAARARRVAPARHRQRAEVRRHRIPRTRRPAPCRPTPPRSCSRSASSAARAMSAAQVVARMPPVEPALQRTAWTVVAHSEFDLQDFAAAETAYVQLAGLRARSSIRSAARSRSASRRRSTSKASKRARRASSTSPSTTSCACRRRLRRRTVRATARVRRRRCSDPDGRLAARDDGARELQSHLPEPRARRRRDDEARRRLRRGRQQCARRERVRAHRRWRRPGRGQARSALALGRALRDDGPERRGSRRVRPVRRALSVARRGGRRGAPEAHRPLGCRRQSRRACALDARSRRRRRRGRRRREPIARAISPPSRSSSLRRRRATRSSARGSSCRSTRASRPSRQRMQEALAAYGKAADYGIAEVTTAANYEIAELYHALSKDLYASERPPELTTDELEQYDILLEEQAFPFEEEAIELHETNAARTADGIYDEWVRKSLAALGRALAGTLRQGRNRRDRCRSHSLTSLAPLELRLLAAGALGADARRVRLVDAAAGRRRRRARRPYRRRRDAAPSPSSPSAGAGAAARPPQRAPCRREPTRRRGRGRSSPCPKRRPRPTRARSPRCARRTGSKPSSSSSS